jgi:hypothetical protein
MMLKILRLTLLTFLFAPEPCEAQSVARGHLTIEPDSSSSYWRILTDAESRTSRVQFFKNDSELLYQEELPEKWIKQNRKNRRNLDKLLSDVLANQLIIKTLKTETLPYVPRRSSSVTSGLQPGDSSNSQYAIKSYINPEGKLYVIVDNPEQMRYKIEIIDGRAKNIYQEFSNIDHYRRRLDISPVSDKNLQLIVSIDKKRFLYDIKRTTKSSYDIVPMVANVQ